MRDKTEASETLERLKKAPTLAQNQAKELTTQIKETLGIIEDTKNELLKRLDRDEEKECVLQLPFSRLLQIKAEIERFNNIHEIEVYSNGETLRIKAKLYRGGVYAGILELSINNALFCSNVLEDEGVLIFKTPLRVIKLMEEELESIKELKQTFKITIE